MSKIANVEFVVLNASGDNYLQWTLDMEILLKSKGLGACIEAGNNADERDKFKAIHDIRHHLAESLKNQYLTMKDPLDLWNALKKRYDHQKVVLLPKYLNDWKNLRFQDFKKVDDYNSTLFKIVATLTLCEHVISEPELIEKTLSTFHSSNLVLQQQYRERQYKTYGELIAALLVAEQNNELLLMNNALRPPGSMATPEANKAMKSNKESRESNYAQRDAYRGRGRGRWNNRGNRNYGRGNQYGGNNGHPQGGQGHYGHHHGGPGRDKWFGTNQGRGRGRGISKPQHSNKSVCHRCGMDGHWVKTCRTPKHFADLYQEKMKKNPELNMAQIYRDDNDDFDREDNNDENMDFETSDLLK